MNLKDQTIEGVKLEAVDSIIIGPELTPMEKFTLDALEKEGREVSPSYLGKLWSEHKHGRSYGSSRDMFGCTSAAYRALRRLADRGLVKVYDRRWETYSALNVIQYER